jgi:HlyD family secretion protein
MRRFLLILVLLIAAGAAGGLWWWYTHRQETPTELILYGNVDLRQVQLAFNNSERIAVVKYQEGDRVEAGEVVACLDTSRLEPQVAQAEAQVAAQRHVVERLRHGSRPEEIAQARANVAAAKADVVNARLQYQRLKKLSVVRLRDQSEVRAVSQEELDNAKAALDVAQAKLAVNQKALDLVILGPRKEDIAQAEAQLRANEAQLAFLRQQLKDATLRAPTRAIIRSRLLEPGEMASPQRPVYSLAILDPKWVRAYVGERDLGKIREGMKAYAAVDSFPGRRFEGWIGFISPVAEFTPKTVQTEELRTSLVYEVRVFVRDPTDELRLGMPATVYVPLQQSFGNPKRQRRRD